MIAYFDKLSKRKVIWIKGSLPSSKFEGVRHSRFAKGHIIETKKSPSTFINKPFMLDNSQKEKCTPSSRILTQSG